MSLTGRISFEEGDFPAAIGRLRESMRRAPDDLSLARALGEALAANGDLAQAQEILAAAAQRAGDADLLVDLAYLCLATGDHTGARAAIARAGTLRPESRDVARAQARIYEALGEHALAIAAARRVTATETSPAVLTEVARLCLEARQFGEAEAVFRRLQTVDPDHFVFAQHGLIWCRLGRGDWRGALELAVGATRADRFDLTTELLAYARDRLFTRMAEDDAKARETALASQFMASLRQHAELHRENDAAPEALYG